MAILASRSGAIKVTRLPSSSHRRKDFDLEPLESIRVDAGIQQLIDRPTPRG